MSDHPESRKVALYHTKTAIIVGVHRERTQLKSMMGSRVENPVIVVVGGDKISLMPMFTLTAERVYFIPDETLLYGVPMTPAPGLVEAYTAKYLPEDAPGMGGIELSTSPARAPGASLS